MHAPLIIAVYGILLQTLAYNPAFPVRYGLGIIGIGSKGFLKLRYGSPMPLASTSN